jgi:hypothetical protein
MNISEMLAQTFILIAEQQRALLEHQRQQSQIIEALQRAIIERPSTVNYIAVEVRGDVKGDVITAIPQPSGKGAVIAYAFLSILSLAIALGTGWWITTESDILGVRFDRAYYVLLAILGMAAALMLFGAMRSTANVQGKHLGVAFDVGGPAALFALVVGGGFWLTQPSPSFNAKIRLHYDGPEADRSAYDAALPLAKLRVHIGFNTKEDDISNQGEITVWDIPARLRDGEFSVELVSDRIQLSKPEKAQHIRFPGPDQVIELPVALKEPPERRSEREKAHADLRKLIESVQMTLYSKDGLLFPAIEIFLASSTEANWQQVIAADKVVQDRINSGIETALQYDSKWGGLLGMPAQIKTELAAALNDPFQGSLPSQVGPLIPAWQANRAVVSHLPDPGVRAAVIQWRDRLHQTYQKVLQALMPLADKLSS